MRPADLPLASAGRKAVHETYCGLSYVRLTEDLQEARRGTVILDDTLIVPGYPSIGRILALRTGLKEQFRAPFWVEEKIDGYNVRIFRLEGEVLAVTRGGYICPFTTDRLADLMDLRIFEEHPELVVCAEVAGPDNPYLVGGPPFVTEDVRLFVFDFMRLNAPSFLPYAEKRALIERYALPGVEAFGRYESAQWAQVRDLLLRLNDEGREGVVLKEDSPRERRSKYVTSNSGIADIEATVSHLLQFPPEYFTQRILRLALFMDEEGIAHDPEFDRRLGAALLNGLFAAIEQFKRERRVYCSFRCRLRQAENAERLLRMLRRAAGHMKIVQRRLEREGEYYVLEFEKTFPRMTGLFGHVLEGGLVYD
jgi:putative ATP-dependent DNA ligase